MKNFLQSTSRAMSRLVSDEEGASAVEYGLLASLIAAAIILAVTNLGSKISATFTTITSSMR